MIYEASWITERARDVHIDLYERETHTAETEAANREPNERLAQEKNTPFLD